MKGRVVVRDPHYPLDTVRAVLTGCEVTTEEGEDAVALLVGPDYPVGEDELERLPELRVVATCSVGHDHVPVDAATARGIWVCNVPDYCVEEMADSALALLLALARGVVELDRSVRAGEWDDHAAGPLRRLSDLRLGVVGLGRIGRAVAERARALGIEVWATDPLVPDERLAAAGVHPAALDQLLRSCNAFSLHLPLTSATDPLIGEQELGLMPHGSLLVNTARGRLLDLGAVLAALADGRLGGAALDTLPVEPPTPEAPPPEARNLIVTPHAAWYSEEAEGAVYRRAVLSVQAALDGRDPADAVVQLRRSLARPKGSQKSSPRT